MDILKVFVLQREWYSAQLSNRNKAWRSISCHVRKILPSTSLLTNHFLMPKSPHLSHTGFLKKLLYLPSPCLKERIFTPTRLLPVISQRPCSRHSHIHVPSIRQLDWQDLTELQFTLWVRSIQIVALIRLPCPYAMYSYEYQKSVLYLFSVDTLGYRK